MTRATGVGDALTAIDNSQRNRCTEYLLYSEAAFARLAAECDRDDETEDGHEFIGGNGTWCVVVRQAVDIVRDNTVCTVCKTTISWECVAGTRVWHETLHGLRFYKTTCNCGMVPRDKTGAVLRTGEK